jgi:hypothetical protein
VNHDLKLGPDTAEGVAAFLDKRAPEFQASVTQHSPHYPVAWPAAQGQV